MSSIPVNNISGNKLILHDHKYAQFTTQDTELFRNLRSFFSYKVAGVEYTPAYQNGWSGINYLFDKKGMFYAGLLPKVRKFLDDRKIEFEELNKTKSIQYFKPLDISKKLKSMGMVPRDHQNKILKAAIENNRGIIRSATGSGKTLATAMITAHYNKPTNIYVIGLDLLQQFHNLFSKIFNEPIGFIGNGTCQIERINIVSIWSIGSALKIDKKDLTEDDEGEEKSLKEEHYQNIINLLKETKLHIFDESHVITTDTIHKIYERIDPEHIYGVSGTPYRGDNTDLLINSILGEQIVDVSASELIKIGLLAQPLIKFIPIPNISGLSMANYQTVYKTYITENAIRNSIIIDQIQKLLEKKYTPLVLFKIIKHGEVLLELMLDKGIKCEMLHGNDSLERRTEVKQMLDDGKINLILASTIFDIGIDIPMLNALVLCGGGKSSVRTNQRLGRILRPFNGKKIAAVVDFYDNVKFLKKHSIERCEIYQSEDGFKVYPCKEMIK